MKVSSLIDILESYYPDDEVAVTVAFPQVDGWEVTSWDVVACDEEGSPALKIQVYGADFDYPGPERALARKARAFLRRYGQGMNNQNW